MQVMENHKGLPIRLEPIQQVHAFEMLCCADDDTMKCAGWPAFNNVNAVLKWIDATKSTTHKHCYAIMHREAGFIGAINLSVIKSSGLLSYWIGKSYWGKGYAATAVHEILKEAYWKFHLTNIFANVDKTNFRSIRLLKKTGFEQLGLNHDNLFFFQKGDNDDQQELCKKLECLLSALNPDIKIS